MAVMNFIAVCREITHHAVKAEVLLDLPPQPKQAVVWMCLSGPHAAADPAFRVFRKWGNRPHAAEILSGHRPTLRIARVLLGATVCLSHQTLAERRSQR